MTTRLVDRRDGVFEGVFHSRIGDIIDEAIELAGKEDRPIELEINRVRITVKPDSDFDSVHDDFLKRRSKLCPQEVDPCSEEDCKVTISYEDLMRKSPEMRDVREQAIDSIEGSLCRQEAAKNRMHLSNAQRVLSKAKINNE